MTNTGRPPAPSWLLALTVSVALVTVAQGVLFVSVAQMFALPSRNDTWVAPALVLVFAFVQLALAIVVLAAGRAVHRVIASVALLALTAEIVLVVWLLVALFTPGSFDF
jgi:hypothetical protein